MDIDLRVYSTKNVKLPHNKATLISTFHYTTQHMQQIIHVLAEAIHHSSSSDALW